MKVNTCSTLSIGLCKNLIAWRTSFLAADSKKMDLKKYFKLVISGRTPCRRKPV